MDMIKTPFTPAEFYRHSYHQLLNSIRYRLRVDIHRAEDLLQEVFIKFLQKMEEGSVAFETHNHAIAYCVTAARNQLINRVRQVRAKKPEQALDIDLLPRGMEPSCHDPLPGPPSDEVFYLQEAIQHLPENFRGTVELALKGYSYQEIGAKQGIPEGTVMSRLWRARERIRDRVSQRMGSATLP